MPTHLYKVILAEDGNKQSALGAFVIPNEPVDFDKKLPEFQVSLDVLAQDSGLIFFPDFEAEEATDLCLTDGCKMMSKERMAMIAFGHRLRNAPSLELLEKVWRELKETKLTPDAYTIDVYESRKRELEQQESESEIAIIKIEELKENEVEIKT